MAKEERKEEAAAVHLPVLEMSEDVAHGSEDSMFRQLIPVFTSPTHVDHLLVECLGQHSSVTFQLTNPENPLFLYHLSLTLNDFNDLKKQQNLNVSFSDFPLHVKNRLLAIHQSEGKVKAVFEHSVLTLTEQTTFKTIFWLVLRFRLASDERIKTFLSERLQLTQKELERARASNDQLTRDKEELHHREVQSLEKTQETVGHLQSVLAQKEEEIQTLERKTRHLATEKDALHGELQKCSLALKLEQQKTGTFEPEVARLRKQNLTLESQLAAVRAEANGQTQAVEHRDEMLRKMEVLNREVEKKADSLQESSALLKEKSEQLEQQVLKGNEVIAWLQAELGKSRNQASASSAVVEKQQEVIKKQQEELLKARQKGLELDRTSRELKGQSKELKRAKEQLEKNQKVIEFLNRELNQHNLPVQPGFFSGAVGSALSADRSFLPSMFGLSADHLTMRQPKQMTKAPSQQQHSFHLSTMTVDWNSKLLQSTRKAAVARTPVSQPSQQQPCVTTAPKSSYFRERL